MECINQGAPESFERADDPMSRLSSFSEIHGSSRCSLGGALERISKAQVGSIANVSVLWKAASIRQLFQSVECPRRGSKSKARSSVRSRALGAQKRDYTSSHDKNI